MFYCLHSSTDFICFSDRHFAIIHDVSTHKVIIHVRLSGVHGRNQLNGIFRYLGRTTAWDIRLTQNESELLEELRSSIEDSGHPDGFIISAPISDEACTQIAKLPTPTVLIDIRPYHISGRNGNLAFVHNDDGGIGLAAAKHLTDLGNFRSFAFIHAKDPRPWSDRRQRAGRISCCEDSRLHVPKSDGCGTPIFPSSRSHRPAAFPTPVI